MLFYCFPCMELLRALGFWKTNKQTNIWGLLVLVFVILLETCLIPQEGKKPSQPPSSLKACFVHNMAQEDYYIFCAYGFFSRTITFHTVITLFME